VNITHAELCENVNPFLSLYSFL